MCRKMVGRILKSCVKEKVIIYRLAGTSHNGKLHIRIPNSRLIIGCIDQYSRLVLIAYLVIVKKIGDPPFSFRFEMYLLWRQHPFDPIPNIFHGADLTDWIFICLRDHSVVTNTVFMRGDNFPGPSLRLHLVWPRLRFIFLRWPLYDNDARRPADFLRW